MTDELPFTYQCLALTNSDNLNVLNVTSYSEMGRSEPRIYESFFKLSAIYFRLCQDIKWYQNV